MRTFLETFKFNADNRCNAYYDYLRKNGGVITYFVLPRRTYSTRCRVADGNVTEFSLLFSKRYADRIVGKYVVHKNGVLGFLQITGEEIYK